MGRRTKSPATHRTHLVVIQDKSGSMSDKISATISGYNEYIRTLKDTAEGDVFVTLSQFDTQFTDVYVDKPLAQVPRLDTRSYVIGGMTALYDAVGKTIRETELVAKDDRVLMVIMTDGEENSSKEFQHQTILDLLTRKRRAGWEFVFLGAGEEAWNTGASLGFQHTNSILYGTAPQQHMRAYGVMAAASANFSSGGSTLDYLATSKTKQELEDEAKSTLGNIEPSPTTTVGATP